MRSTLLLCLLAASMGATLFAASPALTIYNQNFAVVRDTVPLDLKSGVNDVSFANTTAHLEPDSVILRDPAGKIDIGILEQNYRSDPLSQELLLSLFEGKTIDFLVTEPSKPDRVVQGKIIRSAYVPHSQEAMEQYGNQYAQAQSASEGTIQPVVEVNGKIQFGLPGQPIFPSLGDDTILKPALTWKLQVNAPAKLDAELAYITGGMSWVADYNVTAPEHGETVDLVGWITMDNQSGKSFEAASIKLMAGEVNKIQENAQNQAIGFMSASTSAAAPPAVTEKAFDEYHLYTLERPTTLRDRETKQVEFVRASQIKTATIYIYDGLKVDTDQWRNYIQNIDSSRQNSEFGTDSNTKVAVMREFKNSAANGLGIPLPKGRMRCYRREAGGGQLEFTGENTIDHTPKDETVRIQTGNAFDLVGERTRTNFKLDESNHWADESFEIKLRNHKTTGVEMRVVEHLYRGTNWEIVAKSSPFVKTNAQEIEFRAQLKPDEEKRITYTVHYSW